MKNYTLNICEQTICINGQRFSKKDFRSEIPTNAFQKAELKDTYQFLHRWFANTSNIETFTSGSTGVPKKILIDKQKMILSAISSCNFLKLQQGDNALLCMNTKYIGGKMMIVRALVANMNLITLPPCGQPLEQLTHPIDFAAFVPLQVFNTLSSQKATDTFQNIRTIIIGGGAIPPNMASSLKSFSNNIYSTYGMTETLSHIALRRLSGKEATAHYTPLPNIRLSIHPVRNTLTIHAPHICNNPINTNDIAQIFDNGTFVITGRTDNIINSGGIKIQPEKIEELLTPHIIGDFAITSIPDEKLENALVLAITPQTIIPTLNKIKENLPPFHSPQQIITLPQIPRTETEKTDRHTLKKTTYDILLQTSTTNK